MRRDAASIDFSISVSSMLSDSRSADFTSLSVQYPLVIAIAQPFVRRVGFFRVAVSGCGSIVAVSMTA
jgi:hypothetical protein